MRRDEIAELGRSYITNGGVAANRLMEFARSLSNWAVGEGLLERSPFESLGERQRQPGGAEPSRDRVMADVEVRELWSIAHPHANLLRALLLAGARIGELQRARTDHLDGDWLVVPPEHAKNGKARSIFVTPELRAQFDGRAPFLFRTVSATAVQAWVRRLQARAPWPQICPKTEGRRAEPWTPHDCRRTFATLAGRLGIAEHVITRPSPHAGRDRDLGGAEGLPEARLRRGPHRGDDAHCGVAGRDRRGVRREPPRFCLLADPEALDGERGRAPPLQRRPPARGTLRHGAHSPRRRGAPGKRRVQMGSPGDAICRHRRVD